MRKNKLIIFLFFQMVCYTAAGAYNELEKRLDQWMLNNSRDSSGLAWIQPTDEAYLISYLGTMDEDPQWKDAAEDALIFLNDPTALERNVAAFQMSETGNSEPYSRLMQFAREGAVSYLTENYDGFVIPQKKSNDSLPFLSIKIALKAIARSSRLPMETQQWASRVIQGIEVSGANRFISYHEEFLEWWQANQARMIAGDFIHATWLPEPRVFPPDDAALPPPPAPFSPASRTGPGGTHAAERVSNRLESFELRHARQNIE